MAGPAAAGGEGPDGVQVLAALRRAMLHRRPRRGPAPLWLLLEHLAIPRRSAAARRVRVLLGELERDGLIRPGREHGLTVWSVTDAGERRLLTGSEPQLPESPRRRRRRSARTAAARELPRFRARLAGTLAEAAAMLDADADAEGALAPGLAEAPCDGEEAAGKRAVPGAPGSGEWLEIGRRLAADCRRVASAWHCLHEWPEPADEVEDPDEPGDPGELGGPDEPRGDAGGAGATARARRARIAALRNVRLWREEDGWGEAD